MAKKTYYLFVIFVFLLSYFQAQTEVDKQNCREGESIEYCYEHKILAKLLENPVFKKQWEKDRLEIKSSQAAPKTKGDIPSKGLIYKIPVVFHVLHDDGPENISRDQIDDALFILNRDYRRTNADANNVYTPFQGVPADSEIEFVYATKAPDGTCFNGITRTRSIMSGIGSDGEAQVDAIISGNDVYNGQWPGNKYLNIFICKALTGGGVVGYTYRPSNWIGTNMKNGIWIVHNFIGSIGTSSQYGSRSLTHEVGHWLDLPHVWGGTNNPGLTSNCAVNSDDEIDDTPECIGNSTCQLSANTCSIDNVYWGFDQVDPVENYMNYSFCSKMFTPGQATRMRAALNSSVGGRNNISTAANLMATGADSNLYVCEAEFSVSSQYICAGLPVNFIDQSFNNVKGWSWSFPGGVPSNSIVQNPSVVYSLPGKYAVTLVATDSVSTVSTTKTSYITVYQNGVVLPYTEGFETYSSLTDTNSFWRAIGNAATTFEVTNTVGSTGSKSIRLRNYTHPNGTFSELFSKPFDLSAISNSELVTFSFRLAHRRKTIGDYEKLRVHASNDCGTTWAVRKTLLSTSLSTLSVSSEWTPSPSDWVQVHVLNITNNYFVDNLLLKFSFESDAGNNLYIDDINLYTGGPSEAGIEKFSSLANISLYPNPVDEELTIHFSVLDKSEVEIVVKDIAGKLIQENNIHAEAGNNMVLINTSNMASGMYFINLVEGNSKKIFPVIVR